MGFLDFLYRQWFKKPTPLASDIDLSSQTAIITGSNVGLGFEAALELAQHQISRIVLGVRNVQAGERARQQIIQQSPKCSVEVWALDMNSYESTIEFGRRARSLPRVDIVILNAGIQCRKFQLSPTGHELQLQVNYLSTALLSLLLLPTLVSSSSNGARHLTIVSSELYEWTPFTQRSAPDLFKVLDDPKAFSTDYYGISKLLLVLWAIELASKVDRTQVIINCVNPGLCWSSLHRDHDSFGLRVFKHAVAWSTAQGGHCLSNAAVVQTEETHGCFLSEQRIRPYVLTLNPIFDILAILTVVIVLPSLSTRLKAQHIGRSCGLTH